jgi:WD40 repeat protein
MLGDSVCALSTSHDRTTRLWDLGTGTERLILAGHTDTVAAAALLHLGGQPHAITASWDRTLRVWELAAGTQVDQLHFPDKLFALAVARDGTVVVGMGWEVILLEHTAPDPVAAFRTQPTGGL